MNFFKRQLILLTARKRFKQRSLYNPDGISGIVFTKDRPIQLHALLESYFFYTKNAAPLTIIYSCSDSNYQKGYNELIGIWKDVRFISENGFQNTLRTELKSITSKKIFFLVDDIIFTRHYDLAELAGVDCSIYIPSMRLGKNITYSYVRNKEIKQPHFEIFSDRLVFWKWIRKNSYWSYPLSLDGHVFLANEMRIMTELIGYNAPNSLEQNLQIFNGLYFKRRGISFLRSILLNTPWNIVQNEIVNQNENISTEYLLTQWNKGKRINFSEYHDIDNKSCHVALPIIFSERQS